jgi:hypothetical protein
VGLIYFILVSFGLTQILAYGKIFESIKPEKHFFYCPMCIGFWVGVFLFGINHFTELFTFSYNLTNCFCLGCLSSGTSYVLCQLFGDNGLKIENNKEGEDYANY